MSQPATCENHLEGFSRQSSVPAMDWPALSPSDVNPIAYRNGVPPSYRCWAPSGDPDNGLPCRVVVSSPPWNSAVCQVLQLTGGTHTRCCACTTGPASQGQVNAEINDKIVRVPGVYLSLSPQSILLEVSCLGTTDSFLLFLITFAFTVNVSVISPTICFCLGCLKFDLTEVQDELNCKEFSPLFKDHNHIEQQERRRDTEIR